ncbi:MAG TPA: OmpA family protein [Candidatus Binataceae bacterium]|nr:OmpA family protein [Candidatus Binataceae bacterium]
MGTKFRFAVPTAVVAGLTLVMAGCASTVQNLSQPREWDGCALGGAFLTAIAGGVGAYEVAHHTGSGDRTNVEAVFTPISAIVGAGIGAVAGHYLCDPVVPPPAAPVVATAPEAPPPPPPPPPVQHERIVLRGVHFDFNKANIRPDAVPILDEAADILSKNPNVTVDVNGYCDAIGSFAYNLKLSQRRADAVARYLESKGIPSSRLVTHGYGKTHFVASNATAAGRAQNRRVELVPAAQ